MVWQRSDVMLKGAFLGANACLGAEPSALQTAKPREGHAGSVRPLRILHIVYAAGQGWALTAASAPALP